MVAETRRLRIAVVTQYFHPENFRINDLVATLADRGHDVQVVAGYPNYPSGRFAEGDGGILPRRERALGARVTRVPLLPRASASPARLVANYLSFAVSASCLAPVLVKGPIDIVFAYQPSPATVAVPALALARRHRVPALMWVQDLWPQTLTSMGLLSSDRSQGVANALVGSLHRRMDALLVQSAAFRRPLEAQGVEPTRIHDVPNWAEDFYRPVVVPLDAPERRRIGPGFTVLFAGNLGEAQGLDTLVGAAERLSDVPDLRWLIVGEGRRLQWLTGEIADRGLEGRVQTLGRQPPDRMPTWFALADVLVATLRSDPVYELTIPSKLQSYLACGRPVVASLDGEGARIVRQADAGETCPAGDPGELAAAVRRVYDAAPGRRIEMGLAGRAYYTQHFDRVAVIDRIEQLLIQQVVHPRKRAKR